MKENLIITPKTKVAQLLDTYPELEKVLIEYAPAFEKLKNPVLRKTIAHITSLQQAASIGQVEVETLINRLRKEVGQELYEGGSAGGYQTSRPDWFREDKISNSHDAAELLEAGEQPVHQVMADLKNLENGQIYLLKAPFLPAPVIDKASGLGFRHWVEKAGESNYLVYFLRG